MNSMDNLKNYIGSHIYDCSDIAEKLLQMSNLELDKEMWDYLVDAIYHLKSNAQNPYNADHHRVLYNVLLVICNFECFK